MGDVYCYAYVEDAPSKAVVKKLVKIRNLQMHHDHQLLFHGGFPTVTRGFGKLKNKCETFLKMASAGLHILVLTDLNNTECACTLIRDWFIVKCCLKVQPILALCIMKYCVSLLKPYGNLSEPQKILQVLHVPLKQLWMY